MTDVRDHAAPVRVRFAPSPTGNLHLGGARTALFNWLFARRHGGAFILRIEDTDRERSKNEYVGEIMSSLEWLGLCHDEVPYFQSRRLDLYRREAERLLSSGQAYRCFCPPGELEERRRTASKGEGAFRYDGRCARLSSSEVERRLEEGAPCAVRVRVVEGAASWNDLVRGPISIDHAQMDDFVIRKSDGTPTYHFAVVVDDVDMRITHVIRGDDHISNTPKQLVLYQAMRTPPPAFAHLPLIHGIEGGRLSKRHGATAVSDYRKKGYLPEALLNYLALLGWSPGEDREVMTLREMVRLFDLKRVVKTPAVFDVEKLAWMNGVHYATLSLSRRMDLLLPHWMEARLLKPGEENERREWLEAVVLAVGDRIKLLSDIVGYTGFLFAERVEPDEKAAAALAKAAADRSSFQKIFDRLEAIEEFRRGPIEESVRAVMVEDGLSVNRVVQPVRAAISGRLVTPGLYESLELLGRQKALSRIRERLLTESGLKS